MRRDDARDALVDAFDDGHPRVRRAVAAALGEFRGDAAAARALASRLEPGDPSYFVEAEAALALGRTRSPLALEVLPRVLGRSSFQDIIRTRAIEGLGATGDERALGAVKAAWRPNGAGVFLSRRAVASAVAELGAGTPQARAAREILEDCLRDPDFRVRSEAALGLARVGLPEAIPAIERALAAELDGRARRRMNDALRDLRDGTRPAEQARALREEVDRLRGETGKLRERLERLESRLAPQAPPSPEPPLAKAPRPRPRRTTRRRR